MLIENNWSHPLTGKATCFLYEISGLSPTQLRQSWQVMALSFQAVEPKQRFRAV
jgi:hypothetical protein